MTSGKNSALNYSKCFMIPVDHQRFARSKIGEVVKKKDVWRKSIQINTSGVEPEYKTIGAPCANQQASVWKCSVITRLFYMCYKNQGRHIKEMFSKWKDICRY